LDLQGLFSLCSKVESEAMRMMAFLIQDFLASKTRLLVESAWNGAFLHHFKFSCGLYLLITKEVENWVKV